MLECVNFLTLHEKLILLQQVNGSHRNNTKWIHPHLNWIADGNATQVWGNTGLHMPSQYKNQGFNLFFCNWALQFQLGGREIQLREVHLTQHWVDFR